MFQKLPPFGAVVADPLSDIDSTGQVSESTHLVSVRAPGAVVVLQPVGAPQPSAGRRGEVRNCLWVAQNLRWVWGTFSALPPGERAPSESKGRPVPTTSSWLFLIRAETWKRGASTVPPCAAPASGLKERFSRELPFQTRVKAIIKLGGAPERGRGSTHSSTHFLQRVEMFKSCLFIQNKLCFWSAK